MSERATKVDCCRVLDARQPLEVAATNIIDTYAQYIGSDGSLYARSEHQLMLVDTVHQSPPERNDTPEQLSTRWFSHSLKQSISHLCIFMEKQKFSMQEIVLCRDLSKPQMNALFHAIEGKCRISDVNICDVS